MSGGMTTREIVIKSKQMMDDGKQYLGKDLSQLTAMMLIDGPEVVEAQIEEAKKQKEKSK